MQGAQPLAEIAVALVVQNQGVPQDMRVAGFGRSLASAGYRVEIIAPTRPGQLMEERNSNWCLHRFARPPEGPGIWGYTREVGVSLYRIRRTWPRANLSRTWCILHLCNPPDVLWLAFAGRSRRVVRIFDQHDLSPELYLAKGGRLGSVPHRVLLRMERLAYQWADLVIAPNNSYAKVAVSRGRVSANKVHVVRNAPLPDVWKSAAPRAELREGADFVLCYVGSIGVQDGVDELIRTMAWLRQVDPSRRYLCLIAGSGDALGDLRELARSLGIEDSIRFLGWISDVTRLRDIVASADIGVEPCPSNAFNDSSTMIKLTEYLAAGRPVLAYDLPEHRVTVGDAGVLVSPALGFQGLGAAVVAMARDRGRLAQLTEMAGRRLHHAGLSHASSVQALLRVYGHASEVGRSRGAPW